MKRISLGKVLDLGHRVPLAFRELSWVCHFKVARKQVVNQMSELDNKYGEPNDRMLAKKNSLYRLAKDKSRRKTFQFGVRRQVDEWAHRFS